MAKISLRAKRKIGELTKAMEKAHGNRHTSRKGDVSPFKPTKAAALKEAGIDKPLCWSIQRPADNDLISGKNCPRILVLTFSAWGRAAP